MQRGKFTGPPAARGPWAVTPRTISNPNYNDLLSELTPIRARLLAWEEVEGTKVESSRCTDIHGKYCTGGSRTKKADLKRAVKFRGALGRMNVGG